jgi:hypothetical protein
MSRSFFVFLGCFCLFGTWASCSNAPTKPNPTNSEPKTTNNSTVQQTNPMETEGVTPPETVQSEQVRIAKGVKLLTVGNAKGHYLLSCNTNLDSCLSPTPGKDYLVFTKSTRWKFPGAKDYVTLEWLQSWSGSYNNEENVALVPAEGGSTSIGMYWLRSWDKNR